MNLIQRTLVCSFLMVWAMQAAPSPAFGQTSSASVTGLVRDHSGASIAGAKVILKNVDTNVLHETVSNGSGNYTLIDVIPGQYTLEVASPGFRAEKVSAFELSVNQTFTFNATLKPGEVQASVTVEAEGSSVEGATSELGSVIGTKAVNDLPLNGRNFTQLLTLTPGVAPISVGQNASASNTAAVGGSAYTFPSVNGQGNRQNFFMVDGMNDQQAWYNTYAVAPIIDSIQEFKVNSHNDAQFGQVTGGVINVATKPGTNRLHGSAFEYLRNTYFDAKPYFVPTVTPFHQNQFGGTVGGPVLIPRIYNGRDKTFFFAGVEGLHYSQASNTSFFNVPTAAELTGDYDDLYQKYLALGTPAKGLLYDPHTGMPFPVVNGKHNQIQGELDPAAVAYAKLVLPAAIVIPGVASNAKVVGANRQTQWNYTARLDQNIGSRDFIFFRYSAQELDKSSPTAILVLGSITQIPSQQYGASWVHLFGATASLQLQYGRAHVEDNTSTLSTYPNLAAVYGFDPSISNFFGNVTQSANLNVTGYFSGGESSNPSANLSSVHQYKATFTKTLGKHEIQTGASWDQINYGALLRNGTVTFGALQTGGTTAGVSSPGDASASFFLGYPNGANKRNINISERPGGIMSFYAQDAWKLSSGVTVSYGLRYDRTFVPGYGQEGTEGQQGGIETGDFDFNNGTYILQKVPKLCSAALVAPCLPGTGALPANVVVSPDAKIIHDTTTNFGPRLGVAFRANDKMAIRASYGLFFDNWAAAIQLPQNWQGSWPDVATLDLGVLNAPGSGKYTNPHNPFGANSATLPAPNPFTGNNYFVDPRIQNPYSEQYNAGIQQQFGRNTVFSLNYVGSQSHRLDVGGWYNTGQPSRLPFNSAGRANQPGPNGPQQNGQPYSYTIPVKSWDRSKGKSAYNALQASLAKSLTGGLSYTAAYTWSKVIDEGQSGYFGVEGNELQDPYNIRGSRGVAAFNIPQLLSVSINYDLPVGKNKAFSTGNSIGDYLLGNWQLNTIFLMRSGQNFTINASGDTAQTGNGGTYARGLLTGISPNLPRRSAAAWFNTAAFSTPDAKNVNDPTIGEGNAGRNTMQDQTFYDTDLSVFRRFPIRDRLNAEFRAEAFNVLNHPVLGTPNTTVNASNNVFGTVSSTASTERKLQFAAKVTF